MQFVEWIVQYAEILNQDPLKEWCDKPYHYGPSKNPCKLKKPWRKTVCFVMYTHEVYKIPVKWWNGHDTIYIGLKYLTVDIDCHTLLEKPEEQDAVSLYLQIKATLPEMWELNYIEIRNAA